MITMEFLRLLTEGYPDEPLRLEIRLLKPKRGGAAGSRHFDLTDKGIQRAGDYALAMCNGYDVYMGVLPRIGEGKTQADVPYSHWLWADVDGGAEGVEGAKRLIEAAPLDPPTMAVCSGNGLHVYWRLDEPVSLETEEDRERFKQTLRRLAFTIGGIAPGAHSDSTSADPARILRVPGTLNWKGERPIPVQLLWHQEGEPLSYADWQAQLKCLPDMQAPQGRQLTAPADLRPLPPFTLRRMETIYPDGEKYSALRAVLWSARLCGMDQKGLEVMANAFLNKHGINTEQHRKPVKQLIRDTIQRCPVEQTGCTTLERACGADASLVPVQRGEFVLIDNDNERLGGTRSMATQLVDVQTWLRDTATNDDLVAVMQQIEARCGNGGAMALALATTCTRPGGKFDIEAGIMRARDIPQSDPPERYWFGLYQGGLTLLNGVSGAGKSSLLYGVAIHAAEGKTFLNIPFPRPLRVLYIDPENAGNWKEGQGGICGVKLNRIAGEAQRPDNLYFHDGQGINLAQPEQMTAMADWMIEHQIELLILDPLANLFGTENENDNAEAAKQMKLLNDLKRKTGAAIVVCHHDGRTEGQSGGRGATARFCACDVNITMRFKTEAEDDYDDNWFNNYGETPVRELVRLRIKKNRFEDGGTRSLFLIRAGKDRFEVTNYSDWRKLSGADKVQNENKETQVRYLILQLLRDGRRWRSEEIKKELSGQAGEHIIERTLTRMAEEGMVKKRRDSRNVFYFLPDSPAATEAQELPPLRLVNPESSDPFEDGEDKQAAA
ncbi:MAG TPA: AAA family ATPase [Chthonomonadaceae bacterium]|nr:AAA family ATPase [Chthonomonadaceae bacterium]